MDDNVVEYIMLDDEGKEHSLFYYLYETSFVTRWLDILNQNLLNPEANPYLDINNISKDNIAQNAHDLAECSKKLGLELYDEYEEPQLNKLHALFEEWGERRDGNDEQWFLLNELIHKHEDALTSKRLNTYLKMGAVIDIQPLGIHNAIRPEDLVLLSTNFRWGDLYLGYNTLGKDYLTVMQSNDRRAIELDQVKPQERYAAETWLYFQMDQIPTGQVQSFQAWKESLPQHLKNKIPTDLNKLRLGRIPLGRILPHLTPSCMEIDHRLDHWMIDNHPCKEEWNKKYFSKFVDCVDIRTSRLVPQQVSDFIHANRETKWEFPFKVLRPDPWKEEWPYYPVKARDFNQRRVIDELEKVDKYFVPHRANDKQNSYGHSGWKALTLHGTAPHHTEYYDQYGFKSEEEANYQWTSVTKLCPYITEMVKRFPYKKFGRVRIMKIDPGGYIMPHNDTPNNGEYKRIFGPMNIALTQPVRCDFIMEGIGILPFKPGEGFMLDIGRNHCVINKSTLPRYHLIIHGEFK